MRLTIDVAAQEEARALVAFYTERNPKAASRLAELFVMAIERVASSPRRFSLMEGSRRDDVRRARLRGFPIIIIYQLLTDEVFVVAVAHTSREPGYWTSRLRPQRPSH